MSNTDANFEKWFVSQGAELLAPTNQWEKWRFRYGTHTLVVYERKNGRQSWPKLAAQAYEAFKAGKPLPFKKSSKRGNLGGRINRLLDRDGDRCFFCKRQLGEDVTVEHLVPKVHGGPDHISNLALAHKACNEAAGHMSLMEKIAIRESAPPV